MKKLITLFIIIMSSVMLSACSSDYIEISEAESDAIAQYCAHLLLKADKNKVANRKLLDIDEIEDYYEELHKNDPTPEVTPEADATPTTTEAPEETPTPTEAETTPTEAPIEEDRMAESLTELYLQDGFEVEFKSLYLTKTYSENDYSSISAKDGENICAVEFVIKNKSSETQKFVSAGSKVAYALYCKNGDIYAPSLSMLGNDLQFLNDKIEKDEQYTAVLLFIISDKDEPAKLRVESSENGKVFDIEGGSYGF